MVEPCSARESIAASGVGERGEREQGSRSDGGFGDTTADGGGQEFRGRSGGALYTN